MIHSNELSGDRPASSPFSLIDPRDFLAGGMFRQDDFLANVAGHDWSQYRGQRVLVRGCGDVPIPPWAYMAIATRLVGIARSVRYGNEHDNVVIYRPEKP
ncbi:MAG: DUF2480 family protein [candidate division Zixibacteria bacterium]|nr:DUF2480 family protein [candidate division Zixibacteria bacterium]